jgi:hypothetical protein
MYLIDGTYFTRELSIPNVNEMQTEVSDNLEMLVDEKVRLFLQVILGFELYTDLDDNITNGVLDANAPQKWKDLVNGKDYTDGSKRWDGLLQTYGTYKKSLLANYVFYYWLSGNTTSVSGVGEVNIKAKNAVNVMPNQRLSTVWNGFIEMYQGTRTTKFATVERGHGAIYMDWQQTQIETVPLTTFIRDHISEYSNALLPVFPLANKYGL